VGVYKSIPADSVIIYDANLIKLHRMHEMQTTVTDDCRVNQSVCQSVCLSRGSTGLHCANTAKRIKILFGVKSPGGP